MQQRDERTPASTQDLHQRRGRDEIGSARRRPGPALEVTARRPSEELGAGHEERRALPQDERAVGKLVERRLVQTMRARTRIDPLRVELRVDRVGADLVGMQLAPDLPEPHVVLAAAERARAMPRGERGRLIEEEQLGEAARLQQRLAMPPVEPEPARDPALAAEPPPDPTVFVVQAPPVPVHEPASGFGDQFAERRHAVLQRHVNAP